MLVIEGRNDKKIRRVEHIPRSDLDTKTGVLVTVPVTTAGNGYFQMYIHPHADDKQQVRMRGVVKATRIQDIKPPKKAKAAA